MASYNSTSQLSFYLSIKSKVNPSLIFFWHHKKGLTLIGLPFRKLRRSWRGSTQGFTLIEILVTVSVIAIIFGVIISSSRSIQRSQRDAQRLSDLRVIQQALQNYYADQNYYPQDSGLNLTAGTSFGFGSTVYLKKTPKDPIPSTTTPYEYIPYKLTCGSSGTTACNVPSTPCDNTAGQKCQYYILCANFEQPPSDAKAYTSALPDYDYCLAPGEN
jgi:prepilin-type N-terminal cleavage/methylation domain-containing protein